MVKTVSMRLSDDTLEELDRIAQREGRDRSSVIRELLSRGIQMDKIDHAVELYKARKVTTWRAATVAGVSLYEFLDLLDERGVEFQYTLKELEEDLRPLPRERP